MKKKLTLVLLFISSIGLAQTIGSSKDIADVVWPNPEVKLFYGNANYSADHIVILPEHIIIYNAEKACFYLLDKESKLTVSELSLFELKRIVTSRVQFGEMVNNKFRTLYVYKTPFIAHTFANELQMYSLSDTSAYGGLIRIRRDFKIVNLYVRNDSLKLDLLDFDPKKSFRKLTRKEKRQKLYFDFYQTRHYSDFEQIGDKQVFSYGSSPYEHKENIKHSYQRNSYRDSVLNFNALFYRTEDSDSLKLFYQNSYEAVAARLKATANGNAENGFYVRPSLFRIKDKLALWQGRGLDSLIVFDQDLERVFVSTLKEDFLNSEIDTALVDTNKLIYSHIQVFKDEFTEKLYIEFWGGKKGNSIYELRLNYETQTCEFTFLRRYTYYGEWIRPIAINKGIMYLQTKNALVGNHYIYVYDLYAPKGDKRDVLEIKFKKVNYQNKEKKANLNAYVLKYQKDKPLSRKVRKTYFGKIKRDTSVFKQASHLDVLRSISKAMREDTLSYALSYLIAYSGIDRLEIEDDMKAKNYMFFDFIKEGYSKENALSQMNYLADSFNTFDSQMYKNKMMVRTPDGIFFTLHKIDGLWYLASTMKRISTEPIDD